MTGKIVLATGEPNDKAVVGEAGAVGLIVVNTAPGLLRMPAGVLKQKTGFDVTIPVIMIGEADGKRLTKFLERDPDQKVRIIGESSVKGKLLQMGRCASIGDGVEVKADGTTSGASIEDQPSK